MKGMYGITLKLIQPIETELTRTPGLKGAIERAGLILNYNLYPDYIPTTDKNQKKYKVSLDNYSVTISAAMLNELEAVRYALETAKRLEAETSSLAPPLIFNPNLIRVSLRNPKGRYPQIEESIARELQRRLYGGGSVAYYESSGDHKFILGVESEFPEGVETLKAEGTAQPASSLDELLQRLEQKPQ